MNQFRIQLSHKSHPQGRPLKIKEVDALALAVYQHMSTRATKKSVYDDFKSVLGCSYKTLESINRMGAIAMRILFIIMQWGRRHGHIVKYTDATDIPACLKKNADSNKTMKGIAEIGHSSKGWYYGIKMTMTRDALGNLLGLKFTSPRKNDRDIFRSINKDIYGAIVADAGYVSKQLEKDMDIDGKRWVMFRPFKSMKKIATQWQEKLYHSRFQIEFEFPFDEVVPRTRHLAPAFGERHDRQLPARRLLVRDRITVSVSVDLFWMILCQKQKTADVCGWFAFK